MNSKRHLVVQEQPHSAIAEAYRMFRTNILFSKIDGDLKTILFTSSCSGEGKSVSAANTAIALAQSGKKVILLDCDLRKPVQHLMFGRVANGLTDVIFGELNLENAIQETEQQNLFLIASGPLPPNPSEILGSNKMDMLLKNLIMKVDYLIIDSPPVLAVSDACVLASKVDGVILVLGAGIVRAEMAQEAKESLERAKGRLLGVMINRIKRELNSYYGYYGIQKNAKEVMR